MGVCQSTIANKAIMHASRDGKASVVADILSSHPEDATFADPTTGLTPLHLAATAAGSQPDEQYLKVVAALIEAKADVNSRDKITTMTPLLFAVRAQKPKLVNILLENGADARTIVDTRNWTALHFAVGESSFGAQETRLGLIPPDSAILKLILNAKAFVDAKNNTGSTALHLACRHEKAHLVQILLLEQYRTRPTVQDNNLDTPLHFAAMMYDKPNALKALLERKADVNVCNLRNQTPLHIAAINNNEYAVQELLKYSADVSIRDNGGMRPIDHAVVRNFSYLESILDKAGKDPNRGKPAGAAGSSSSAAVAAAAGGAAAAPPGTPGGSAFAMDGTPRGAPPPSAGRTPVASALSARSSGPPSSLGPSGSGGASSNGAGRSVAFALGPAGSGAAGTPSVTGASKGVKFADDLED